MTFQQAAHYIESLKPTGMKWGLERMGRILSLCGHPEKRLRVVHVAGTNGKGSTARMIQCILTASGYRTGLYASPAVTGIRDTVTVDGAAITEETFAALTEKMASLQGEMGEVGSLSEFELTTALAFLYFASQHTDLCVIECGLGGQDDATNILPAPLAAVLTPISLDHTAVLGRTVEEITTKKCGIIKPPCAIVTSPKQDEDALAVILETASRHGLTVRIPASGSAPLGTLALGRTEFEYDHMQISLPLTGAFQRDNALTAIETVRALADCGFPVTNEDIQKGLNAASMPCRQEVICRDPLILLDGAHNPQGVGALAETLRLHSLKEVTLLTGMLADKDTSRCMQLLAPFCRRAICCTPDNSRALPAADLAQVLHEAAEDLPITIADAPSEALAIARKDSEAPLLIAGSFYVASALRPLFYKKL